MQQEHALVALLAQHRLLLRGDGSIARGLELRLAGLDVPWAHDDASATDAIVTWEPPPRTPAELGVQTQQLTGLLDAGTMRRVVLLVGDDAAVAARVAETLTLYVAAHLVQKKTRFNMVRLPASPTAGVLEQAANTTLMLLCGRMDAVHGQVLTLSGSTKSSAVSA